MGQIVNGRSQTVATLRPPVGPPITVTSDCLSSEVPIGGGVRVSTTNPADVSRLHLQEDGPTDTGWLGRVAAISRFAPGSSLIITVTAYCVEP